MNLELHIPDDAASVLAAQYPDLPRAALEALALEGYRSMRLSDGQVREMLGFSSRMQVHAFLKERGVHLNYSLADLEQDRETSRGFEAK
jgi:predicted HTH domain antitoxin